MAKQSRTDLALVVLGVLAWGAAVYFGNWGTVKAVAPKPPTPEVVSSVETVAVEEPNIAAAGAACGFAIGGGLCFLGAALAAAKLGGGAALQPTAAACAITQGLQSPQDALAAERGR
jgi:hypothetical protein